MPLRLPPPPWSVSLPMCPLKLYLPGPIHSPSNLAESTSSRSSPPRSSRHSSKAMISALRETAERHTRLFSHVDWFLFASALAISLLGLVTMRSQKGTNLHG